MNQPTCRTLQLSVKELGRSSDFMASNVFWVYGGGVSSSNSYKTLCCQTIVATSCHQRKKFSVRAVAKIDIVSPFSDKAPEEKKLYSAETYAFTLENVDSVLNEVRPYLIADGGNVTVVSIDDGIVCLQLQGACGSCPSSTSTMKMGIERVLKEKFGDAVKDVIDIDKPATSDDVNVTVADVDGHLEMLRPAIESYGGEVEVMSVDCSKGECRVKYTGPTTLANGIEATIKDKFPQIHTITLE